jgi:hypothetical protein
MESSTRTASYPRDVAIVVTELDARLEELEELLRSGGAAHQAALVAGWRAALVLQSVPEAVELIRQQLSGGMGSIADASLSTPQARDRLWRLIEEIDGLLGPTEQD